MGNHQHLSHKNTFNPDHVKTAFYIGIVLNLAFVCIEVVYGFYIHSLALLSDAGHNFLDVISLSLSLFSFWLIKRKSNIRYTYGYKKSGILIALFNAIVLIISIGFILYEAILRLQHAVPLQGITMSIIAAIGVFVNGVSAMLFLQNKDKDINVKSAYLHLFSDAILAFGVVIGGIVIYYTSWYWVDAVLSIIICTIIIYSTFNLLKSSLRLSMDGLPDGIELSTIKESILSVKGVLSVHHIHIWAISTIQNGLTAHVLIDDIIKFSSIKAEIKQQLLSQNIHHSTLEFETELEVCKQDCD